MPRFRPHQSTPVHGIRSALLKFQTRLLALLAAVALASGTRAATNLIPCDTSFESGISHLCHWSCAAVDDTTTFHGRRSLKLAPEQEGAFLISPIIYIDRDKPHVFSVFLKGTGQATIKIITISPSDCYDANWEKAATVKLIDEWQRFSVVLPAGWNTSGKWEQRPRGGEPFRVAVTAWAGSSVWGDAMQLEAGDTPTDYTPSESCSITVSTDKPWNVFLTDEDVALTVAVWNAQTQARNVTLRGEVRDYDAKPVAQCEQALSLGALESKQIEWPLPPGLKGFFTVQASLFCAGNPAGATQSTFCVVSPPRGVPNPDSFFGLQGPVNTDDDAEAMHRIGVRWWRADAGWGWMQPKPDQFHWASTERRIDRFAKFGMDLMMLVDGVPEWARMPAPPEEKEPWRYPPKDMRDLENFMFQLVDRFKDKVTYWEVRNEPDIGYLKIPPDSTRSKASIYADMVCASAAGARRASPDARICACGVITSDMSRDYPFATEVFKTASDCIDIMPVHPYLYPRRVGLEDVPTPEAFGLRDLYLKAAEFTRTRGKGQPIWNGEQGLTLDTDAAPDSEAARLYTNFTLRSILLARATNVERLFYFYSYDARLSNNCKGFWLHGKRPLPVVAAYANLAQLLDGKLLQVRTLELCPQVEAHVFQREDASIACVWTSRGAAEMEVRRDDAPFSVLNTMGNPVDTPETRGASAKLRLGADPLFLVAESQAFKSLCQNIADARLSIQALDLDIRLPATSRVVVTLRNNLNKAFAGRVSLTTGGALEAPAAKAEYQIKPLKTTEVEFPLDAPRPEALDGAVLTVLADSPYGQVKLEKALAFRYCGGLSQPPVIDGDLGDWQDVRNAIALDSVAQVRPADVARHSWRGTDDLSAKAWVAWDQGQFYFAAAVRDDVHCNGKAKEKIWDGDSIQLALDLGNNAVVGKGYDADDRQFNIALTADGPLVEAYPSGLASDASVAIRTAKGITHYEVAIPWARLGAIPDPGQIIGLSFVVNDDDGRGRIKWLGLTDGIVEAKSPVLFEKFVLAGVQRTAGSARLPVFHETFDGGDAALGRWDYTGASIPAVAPSPMNPARQVFANDFRVTLNWRMLSKQQFDLAPGGQYTLSGRLCARGPYSTVTMAVERPDGNAVAQVMCPDTKGRNAEVSTIFWAPPEPTAARMRVSGGGCGGEAWIEEVRLTRNEPPLSTYPTGLCIRRPALGEPFSWVGVLVQAEDVLADPNSRTDTDTDNDGRWALCRVPRAQNPWMFTETTVLKSDSLSEEEGGRTVPLHLACHGLAPGKYHAYLNDPFRDAAVSLDGKQWKRVTGGKGEISLGVVTLPPDAEFEFWIRHQYKTVTNPGPVYVDYVRFVPLYDASAPPEKPTPVLPVCTPVGQRESELLVRASGGPARAGEWVVTGIPFPSGEFPESSHIAVDGAQDLWVKPLVRWPDGSTKWLRVSFRADCPDGKDRPYRVRYGTSVPAQPTAVPRVTRANDAVTLKAGDVEVLVKNGVWQELRYKGKVLVQGPPGVLFTCKPDVTLNQLVADKVSVEGEDGPCPAVVVEGHLAKDGVPGPIVFRARLVERADCALSLAFSIMNTAKGEPKPDGRTACGFLQLTSCSLILPGIKLSPQQIVWPTGARPPSARQTLEQTGTGESVATFKGSWTLTDGDATVASGERTDGWVDLCEPGLGLTIGVREFLEKCPKSLTVRRDGDAVSVEVGIWPATMSNPFWFGQGTQISTELALVPHEAITPEQRASRLAAVRQPLCATLTPEEYCRAGVFWEVTPAKQSRWPVYDRHVAKAFQTICQDCTAYGIEDWGDAFVPGGPYVRGMTKLWINNEHDLCAALVSQFARTGEIAYLERAKPLARHVVNADVIRCHEKKAWIGGVYQHSPGMEVGHQVDSPRFSHAGWPLGMLWVYYLTGDESLKDICSLADYIVANLPDVAQVLMREERDCGYPLVTLCSIYDLTRNPKHLDAAHRIVDYVLRCQNPKTGGWTRPIYETPPYRGSTSSFANTLCRGLDYYLSLTGDSRVRDCLERAGAWVAADTMSLLAYAEVAAVSAKSISSAKLIEARAVKDLTALFPEKDVAGLKIEKSVITTVPRNMPFQVMGYSRLMGVLTKHAGEQPPARE